MDYSLASNDAYQDHDVDSMDFYTPENYEEQLDSDGISSEEELFIQGYMES